MSFQKTRDNPYKGKERNGPGYGYGSKDENNSTDFQNMVNVFWNNITNPSGTKNNELEVRFGTKNRELGIKPFTKINYDNVIQKLKSLGFTSFNEEGVYMLRIQNEFLDKKTGKYKTSYSIRTEINGLEAIKAYCGHNDINKLLKDYSTNVDFYIKEQYTQEGNRMYPVNFNDFNFRVSYQTEEKINKRGGIVTSIVENWDKSLKNFRFINRVTLSHPDFPINVDMSIVKSSSFNFEKKQVNMTYTTEESKVFTNPETYEFELEVDNSKLVSSSYTQQIVPSVKNANELLASIKKQSSMYSWVYRVRIILYPMLTKKMF